MAMALDAPPAQPPSVATGGPTPPPMAPVGGMLAAQANQPDSSMGAINAAWEAMKKVMDRISQMDSEAAPYVARMQKIFETYLENKAGGGKKPEGPEPAGSNKPMEIGPGQGFPG